MADNKPEHLRDVSKMSFEERYKHIQNSHKLRQMPGVTPHDLRVAARANPLSVKTVSPEMGKL